MTKKRDFEQKRPENMVANLSLGWSHLIFYVFNKQGGIGIVNKFDCKVFGQMGTRFITAEVPVDFFLILKKKIDFKRKKCYNSLNFRLNYKMSF